MTEPMMAELSKWDMRFLELARHVAGWSKGPRRQVGAVIGYPDKSYVTGYNGPPAGYDDEAFLNSTREEQHKVVLHAEDNAILRRITGKSLYGATMYVWSMYPCHDCAQKIVKAGIRRVVAVAGPMSADWLSESGKAVQAFEAAGVEIIYLDAEPFQGRDWYLGHPVLEENTDD